MGKGTERIRRYARAVGRRAGLIVVVLVSMAIGVLLHAAFSPGPADQAATKPATGHGRYNTGEAAATVWTCSMHPEVRRSEPGLCPKCGMKLVPVRPTAAEGLREFSTTDAAKALMDIEVATVERRFVETTIRMVGKVDYDETRLAYITAWVPGRLDKLYVDYTGVPVKKADHMVYIYSPELLGAQEELIQALESAKALKRSEVGIVRETTEATVTAAREKLRLLGLKPKQIAEIEKTGKASDHLTIYAPAGGIVVHKNAQEGMYVNTGTRIYTIADLSQVWVKLDAYESDLMWLRYGQKVEFTTVSYPGETFEGTVAFIDPILTPMTRTVKLRVNAHNADGRLKPGMFVKATVRAQVAASGRVMAPDLAGKWMCPMHPDVIKAKAGDCDICKMPLVRTESLGYVSAEPSKADRPLVIPVSSVLKTGTRAVVYVQQPAAERPTYEGREIVLGPRAGDYYLVRNGLTEGERVVVRGNFKIDSALQILAKPSMMSPEGGAVGGEHTHHAGAPTTTGAEKGVTEMKLPPLFRYQVHKVLAAAESATRAAKEGQTTPAVKEAFAEMGRRLSAVGAEGLQGHAAMVWKEYAMRLSNDAEEGKAVKTPKDLARVVASLGRNAGALRTRLGLAHGTVPPAAALVDATFLSQLKVAYTAYLELQTALASDQLDQATQAGTAILAALEKVDMELVRGEDHMAWMRFAGEARTSLKEIVEAKKLADARSGFALLSEQVLTLAKRFGPPPGTTLYAMRCPMAFDNRGAIWLQDNQDVCNPYFGRVMPECGAVGDVISARRLDRMTQPAMKPDSRPTGHEHSHPAESSKPGPVVNGRCPILGTAIDPTAVPAELVRTWKGQRVGFCCAGCPEAWDKLSPAEKNQKLRAAMPPATTQPVQVWTCSMHPQIRRPQPGKCPICAMELVPLQPAKEGSVHD